MPVEPSIGFVLSFCFFSVPSLFLVIQWYTGCRFSDRLPVLNCEASILMIRRWSTSGTIRWLAAAKDTLLLMSPSAMILALVPTSAFPRLISSSLLTFSMVDLDIPRACSIQTSFALENRFLAKFCRNSLHSATEWLTGPSVTKDL